MTTYDDVVELGFENVVSAGGINVNLVITIGTKFCIISAGTSSTSVISTL